MNLAPVSLIILFTAMALIFLGVGQRVLDRMRLTDTQALALLAVMVAGVFLPEIRLTRGIAIDIGGLLAPLGVAIYLLISAGTVWEKTRAILASLITAAVVYAGDKIIPPDPGPVDSRLGIDPTILPALAGGLVAYLFGRSRRAAFIAGTLGVVLTDVISVIENAIRGVPGAVAAFGGAGAFDASVISGFLAVALAELIGETREFLQGGPKSAGRPEGLLRGLRGRVAFGSEGDGEGGSRPGEAQETAPATEGRGEVAARQDEGSPVSRGAVVASLVLSALLIGGGSILGTKVAGESDELLHGQLFTVRTEDGRTLMVTGRRVHQGDEYIDERNDHYVITSVQGLTAVAHLVGRDNPLSLLGSGEDGTVPVLKGAAGAAGAAGEARAFGRKRVTIGLYHTHNDESYVPNQKAAAIDGKGGIHAVGHAFAKALTDKGYRVVHKEDVHLPHDNGAYRRSRRTASSLINRQKADVVFDVHRDAGPSYSYAKKVDDKWVTQIRLVVGRQNPQIKGPLTFAKELKAIADDVHPGLVKGIFLGREAYNQDLGPHTLLLEVGTEQNAMQSAQRGIVLFADVVDRWVDKKLR